MPEMTIKCDGGGILCKGKNVQHSGDCESAYERNESR